MVYVTLHLVCVVDRLEFAGVRGVIFIRPAISDAYSKQRAKNFFPHHSVQKVSHRERPIPVQQHYINLNFFL